MSTSGILHDRSPFPHTRYDVVAIAASAGGLTAISVLLAALPVTFPSGVLVVQHLDPQHPSKLVDILSRRTELTVQTAETGEFFQPGQVYVAPPDRHLIVQAGGVLFLSKTELVHFVRPSADCLFESVAANYPSRAIAVILTGNGSDGSQGAVKIKQADGIVIAQDKNTAEYFGMPGAAIATGVVDYILPLQQIAPQIIQLVQSQAPAGN